MEKRKEAKEKYCITCLIYKRKLNKIKGFVYQNKDVNKCKFLYKTKPSTAISVIIISKWKVKVQ